MSDVAQPAAPADGKGVGIPVSPAAVPIMRILAPTVFLQVTAGCMLLQSRPQLALRIMGGDSATTGILLGQLVSTSALAEFFVNPVFGRMSDTYGRALFLKIGCFVPTVLRAMVFARPGLATIALDRVASPAVVSQGC